MHAPKSVSILRLKKVFMKKTLFIVSLVIISNQSYAQNTSPLPASCNLAKGLIYHNECIQLHYKRYWNDAFIEYAESRGIENSGAIVQFLPSNRDGWGWDGKQSCKIN